MSYPSTSGGGSSEVTLLAGTAIAGKFGIDQTTPGTTDAVTVKTIGAYAPASYVSSSALESGKVVSASAAVFLGCMGYNSKASAQFIQVHDSAAAPADTAIPKIVITVPASSNFSIEIAGIKGVSFTNGIYLCNSSTVATKTIGLADCFFTGVYR
jgi:hypothetical protein